MEIGLDRTGTEQLRMERTKQKVRVALQCWGGDSIRGGPRGSPGRRPEVAGRMDCRGGDTMVTMLRGEERTARGDAPVPVRWGGGI
jgi:hypothetical protein